MLATMEALGFYVSDMAGGCTALVHVQGDTETVITRFGDTRPPQSMSEPVTVGVYVSGEQVSARDYVSLAQYVTER